MTCVMGVSVKQSQDGNMEVALRSITYVLLVYGSFATGFDKKECGAKNYDVSSLHATKDWFFDVQNTKVCVEPDSTCSIYFTVCQSLSLGGQCTGDSGICERVVPNGDNKIHKFYSLGTVTNHFDVKDDKNGFIAFYVNGTNTTTCPDHTSVMVTFTCDADAKWNFATGNVTEYVVPLAGTIDPCQILFEIKYSGACIKEVPDIVGCNSLEHYDLTTMRNSSLWYATVPESTCKNPFVVSNYEGISTSVSNYGDDGDCMLMFSFCEPLEAIGCTNSIFCQQDTLGKAISFGSYNSEFKIDGDADYTGFTINAYDGTKTKNCTNGFYTSLIFSCSKDANWDSNSGDISKYVKAYPNQDDCEFLVEFNYDGACTSYRPSNRPSNTRESPFGGILIGLFFLVLISYFVIGAIVQYARGRRGPDIVPNNGFWTTFFMLVLEGCRFSLDAVTCFKLQSRGSMSHDYEKL